MLLFPQAQLLIFINLGYYMFGFLVLFAFTLYLSVMSLCFVSGYCMCVTVICYSLAFYVCGMDLCLLMGLDLFF